MKKVFILVTLALIGTGIYAQEAEVIPGPAITFEESEHNFGDIKQGDKVEHTFTFENTGDAPLIITDVRVTCGCTATNWSRDPIPPGETSTLTVKFNSAGKRGMQNKVVTIVSNAVSPLNQVKITTNVVVGES
jgi:hypothetical protein